MHTLNLTGVLSESKRIIFIRPRYFLSLSLLLFLPLSFSLIINSPILRHRHLLPNQPLTAYLIYTLILYVLTICAIGTITYSTHHAFFGEPIKFYDSLKSLTFSLFPLASTAILAHVLIILISLTFVLVIGIVLMLVHNLGFVVVYNSVYFMCFSAIMGAILVAIIIYFYVEWSLAFVVVVIESKWGFTALKRSSYLVKGMRSVSLLVMLYFGGCGASFVSICSVILYVGNFWMFIVNTMFFSISLMFVLLRFTAANTVLYNYCKALHGELAIEVHDYTNLPSDGEDVPHVVVVVASWLAVCL